MRPRGSVFSQVLLVFAAFAVLIAIAAGFGYAGLSGQDSAARQLTAQDYLLQRATGHMQEAFNVSQVSVSAYALSGRPSFLRPLRAMRAKFAADARLARALAPPDLQDLVTGQMRAASRLFAVSATIVRLPRHSARAAALAAGTALISRQFYLSNKGLQERLAADVQRLTRNSGRALATGLKWSAAAIAAAVLLVLASSLATVHTITRPLRKLTATVRRLTAGDYAARATLGGAAEVREVAQSVNVQADEADRLRAEHAESNRLRAMAREAGMRIREHLVADDVLNAARLALERNVSADVVYLRLLEEGHLGAPLSRDAAEVFPPGAEVFPVPVGGLEELQGLFRTQSSKVVQDVRTPDGERIPAGILAWVRQRGVVSRLLMPFGVGSELLGIIIAERMHEGNPWTPAEVDAVESIAADLGRGLHHARLYEGENRLVAELKALDQAKSDFFATVSHELRAPLTTIEGYIEMLTDHEADPVTPSQRKMLGTIDRSTVRLRSLIDDVFTLAKLESGAPGTLMRPVNVCEVIAAAAEAVRPSVTSARLTLTLTGAEGELIVDGDAGQLERVFINLLSNAVKFTPGGGHVRLAAAHDGGLAVVSVADTGIGVPEHAQKELFTRFYRAANATARRIPGTGLGLVIVRTIVTNHGGGVELSSTENAGTTVTVRLPLRDR
jgi:signal transduction histidine kinase/HAMP domain-containing protein